MPATLKQRVAALEADMETMKEQLERSQMSAAMRRSIKQIELGQGVPAIAAVKALGRKYGITKS